jgi:hypothetical protein
LSHCRIHAIIDALDFGSSQRPPCCSLYLLDAIGFHLLLLVTLVCMVSIIPLAVWAATGSAMRAFEALRGYLLVMAILIVPPVVLAAITLLPRIWNG